MPVYVDVPSVASRFGIQKPYQLMKFVNERLPHRNMTFVEAQRLMESKDRSYLKNTTLDELCTVFNCEPGEFYKRVKSKASKASR